MRTERLYALSSELSRVMLPQAVVRAGSAALEALTASVVLVSADGKAFELRAAHGFPQGALRGFERFPLDAPVMCREVYRHGRPVLYESLEAFLRDYPERGLVLETRGELWGEWDADRLAQLLGNLLLNALTHGVEQEPVRVLAAGEGARVVLEVRNPGGPIPAELLPRLFQPFTRASTGVRRSRGWGWGCSSCRRSSPRTEAASG